MVDDLVRILGIIGDSHRHIVAHGMNLDLLQQRYLVHIVLGVNAVVNIGLNELLHCGGSVLVLAGKYRTAQVGGIIRRQICLGALGQLAAQQYPCHVGVPSITTSPG